MEKPARELHSAATFAVYKPSSDSVEVGSLDKLDVAGSGVIDKLLQVVSHQCVPSRFEDIAFEPSIQITSVIEPGDVLYEFSEAATEISEAPSSSESLQACII